jgi:hypothetical protein
MTHARTIFSLLTCLHAGACGGTIAGNEPRDAGSDGSGDGSQVSVGDDEPPLPYEGGTEGSTSVTSPHCVLEESTTLPHVHIVFHVPQCVFTLAQVAAGVSFAFDLVVEQDVPGFTPDSPYWYGSDAANLVLGERVFGGSQSYCLCDKGLPYPECPLDDGGVVPPDGGPQGACAPVTIPAGVYHETFAWDGRNWTGPSDTDNPEGPPFPPADYELDVTTQPGSIAGMGSGLAAKGRLLVRLTP